MQVETLPINQLHADPSNVRAHGGRNLQAIQASLARFGQQKPIVVDPQNVVVAGNGTLEAARALGWTELWVVRTDLSGSQATAYAIADNRTAELAEWDEPELLATLQRLQEEDAAMAEATGFDDAEVDELIASLNAISEAAEAEALKDLSVEEDPPDHYRSTFGVVVRCQDEAQQKRAYELLTAEGFDCRVLST